MKHPQTGLTGQLSDIDFRLLRIFKAVVECGGYSAAEVVLNINRSTISIHMSDLESRLGMVLCNRGRGRSSFSLTHQGEEVYGAICELLNYVEQFRNRVNAIQSQLTGKLRIALPDDLLEIPQIDLAPVITQFREQAPNVNLEVVAHSPSEVDLDILNGQADLGINVISLKRPGLEYLPIYQHQTSLYCSDNHPLFEVPTEQLTVEEVIQYDLVGSSYTLSPEVVQRYNLFTSKAVANHMSGRTLMILSGTYVGFLPEYYAQKWVDAGRLKKLDLKELNYSMDNAVIYRKGEEKNVLIKLFLETLADKR